MFLRKKKKNVYPCKPWFYCIIVGFKGVKIIYRHVFVMQNKMNLVNKFSGMTVQIYLWECFNTQQIEHNHLTTLFPAGTQRRNNVDSTLIQRQYVESTLNRRCFNAVCLLGFVYSTDCKDEATTQTAAEKTTSTPSTRSYPTTALGYIGMSTFLNIVLNPFVYFESMQDKEKGK